MIKIKKKRKRYSIVRSTHDLETIMPELPNDEVYKFVSDGGFSSISFIKYIADRTVITGLHASSFRIGRKELQMIDALHQQGRIGDCSFAVGTLMKNDSVRLKQYKYYDNFVAVCEKNGWKYVTVNNHSKLLLFDTGLGKFVLETSSNLNDNPKIEQFSFERDEELYMFYKNVFEMWGDEDGR